MKGMRRMVLHSDLSRFDLRSPLVNLPPPPVPMPKRSALEHHNYDTPVWSIIVAGVFDCATCAKSQQRLLVGLASTSSVHFPAMQPPVPLSLGGLVLSGVAGPVRDILGDLWAIGRAENRNFSG